MKKINTFLLFVLGLCLAVLSSCGEGTITPVPEPEPQAVKVAFENLAADGSDNKQSTQLTFTLSPDVADLTVADITFDAKETGAKLGKLTGTQGTYTLELTDFDTRGTVYVGIARKGYDISPESRSVFLYKPEVVFHSVRADGSEVEQTTLLTFWIAPIPLSLRAEDITLVAGETGAVKGALSIMESGWCTLALSGVVAQGEIEVKVAIKGYEIEPESQKVMVYPYPADGPEPYLSPELVAAIESQSQPIRFFKNTNGQVSVKSNKKLISSVKSIGITNKELASLDGIEHFTELERLFCGENNFTSLQFPALPKLTFLWCYNNKQHLTRFDVSKLTALQTLDCHGNGITALDLTGLTNLGGLNCSDNKLNALDIAMLPNFHVHPTQDSFWLGEQRDANGQRQDMILTVTAAQNALITANPEWKAIRGNYNLVVVEKQ